MCPFHPITLFYLILVSPLVQYSQAYLNGFVIPNFTLFSCPHTPWVRHPFWMDPWSDDLTHLLRGTLRLSSQPRVINVVGTLGVSSMVNLMERSIPSSYVSSPLYKPASSLLILYFLQRIHDQSATASFDKPAYRPLRAPVIYTSHVVHL